MTARCYIIEILISVCLLLCSCAANSNNHQFAGNWIGSGSDSEGNENTFTAKVIDMGDGKFRVLILDKLDTNKKPLHVMDGELKNNEFPHTADNGIYTGSGKLSENEFAGYYKGPYDGTYKMQRVE